MSVGVNVVFPALVKLHGELLCRVSEKLPLERYLLFRNRHKT